MFSFVNYRILFVLLASLFLVFSVVQLTKDESGEIVGFESYLKMSVNKVHEIFSFPVMTLGPALSRESKGKNKIEAKLLSQEAQIFKLQREVSDLQKIISYNKEYKRSYIPVRVIARSPDAWNHRIVINGGTKDGVFKGMLVTTTEGLIGRVLSTTPHTSDVQLMINTGSYPTIAANIQGGKVDALGFIKGYDYKKQRMIMTNISASAKLEKGFSVVTSRFSNVYTAGIIIGKVDEIKSGDYGIDQTVYIKPTASFNSIDYVLVVRDPVHIPH